MTVFAVKCKRLAAIEIQFKSAFQLFLTRLHSICEKVFVAVNKTWIDFYIISFLKLKTEKEILNNQIRLVCQKGCFTQKVMFCFSFIGCKLHIGRSQFFLLIDGILITLALTTKSPKIATVKWSKNTFMGQSFKFLVFLVKVVSSFFAKEKITKRNWN